MLPKLKLILFFVGLIYLLGCTKNNNSTNTNPGQCDSLGLVKTPNEIPWVQQIIAGRDCTLFQGAQMSTCIYHGQLVVYFENPLSNLGACVGKVYQCNGVLLMSWMENGWMDFEQNHTDTKVFFKKN